MVSDGYLQSPLELTSRLQELQDCSALELVSPPDESRGAATLVARAEPARAPSRIEAGRTDIGEPVTAGSIAEGASNGVITKTETLVDERVEAPSRALKADPQNEPHLGVFAPIETPQAPDERGL